MACLAAFLIIVERGKSELESDVAFTKIFSGQHQSMILGTSRAAMLDASTLCTSLQEPDMDCFNYAFHLGASPYGPKYARSILNRIDPQTKNGVFILCIDPWALATKKATADDSTQFQENETFIEFNPNQVLAEYRYFIKNDKNPYYSLFLPKKEKSHLEQEGEGRPSEAFVEKHQRAKLEYYKKNHLNEDTLSGIRLAALDGLITKLSTYGSVFLVRLPISSEMMALEKQFSPEFSAMMEALAQKHQAGVIDFYPFAHRFLCPDGNHLYREDALRVSATIGNVVHRQQLNPSSNGGNLLQTTDIDISSIDVTNTAISP